MANRDDLVRKIRALQEKTVNSGCTEAEALAASKMALDLCAKYSLTFSDIELTETECERDETEGPAGVPSQAAYVIAAVATFGDCRCWQTKRRGERGVGRVTFFGMPEDVRMAKWLFHTIATAMIHETGGYLATCKRIGEPGGRSGAHAFRLGMAMRVGERLRAIKGEQSRTDTATTGRNLVVVKMATVNAQFAASGVNLRSTSNRTSIRDSGAYSAGKAAGDRVGLNRPIGGRVAGLLT
eukprot:GHVR01188367.1.p1 GENE.GHVR01188367.1~~GHVR01188367.1.p1  ORF type:complete len:240 (+),score=30.87 GHVR01188367.1:978-1697(+)